MKRFFVILRAFFAKLCGCSQNGGRPEAVDLGLSVKWATCNIGANSQEEYGDYFAWGETETKSGYSRSTYKWCKGANNKLTKYCPSDKTDSWDGSGCPDNRLNLLLEDDVARAKWGGKWRMPTDAEFKELLDNCEKEWITCNGVEGGRFTSMKNGKSIFLPAAGSLDGTDLYSAGFVGGYWSSSLSTIFPNFAWGLYFNSGIVGTHFYPRYAGLSVRPVSEY